MGLSPFLTLIERTGSGAGWLAAEAVALTHEQHNDATF
jgi:hypothetical protein